MQLLSDVNKQASQTNKDIPKNLAGRWSTDWSGDYDYDVGWRK
jgi:hypothetical protein